MAATAGEAAMAAALCLLRAPAGDLRLPARVTFTTVVKGG